MFLNEKIEKCRIDKKLTQNELGRIIGSSGTHIRQLESGIRKNPHISSISILAKGLDMTVDELLKDTEFDPKNLKLNKK